MKLYTEEQVLRAIQMGDKYRYLIDDEESGILSLLKPIELPSDEEEEIRAKEYVESKWEYAQDENKESFIEGAKWMKEQILNQIK